MSHPYYDEERRYQRPNLWRHCIEDPVWATSYYPKQFSWIFKAQSGLVPITVYRDVMLGGLIWDHDPNLIRLVHNNWTVPLCSQETWAINQAFYWINHPKESPIQGLDPQELLTKLFYYDNYNE